MRLCAASKCLPYTNHKQSDSALAELGVSFCKDSPLLARPYHQIFQGFPHPCRHWQWTSSPNHVRGGVTSNVPASSASPAQCGGLEEGLPADSRDYDSLAFIP